MTEEKKTPINKISINGNDFPGHENSENPRNNTGWDGKALLEKNLNPSKPEALSDQEHSNKDMVVVGDVIEADEGT